jgi:hypothetical protein
MPRLDPDGAVGNDPPWCPPGTPFGIGPAPDEPAEASARDSENGVSTLVGVKLAVPCGVSTLVGVSSCRSPTCDSLDTLCAGDDIFDLVLTKDLLSLDGLTWNPLAWPDVFLPLDLPRKSAWESSLEDRGKDALDVGDPEVVKGIIPWRGPVIVFRLRIHPLVTSYDYVLPTGKQLRPLNHVRQN